MTWDGRTWSPEAAEDDSFRPDLRQIQLLEVHLSDDEFEGLELVMSHLVRPNVDDVDPHRNNIRLNLIGRHSYINASDVAIDCERSSAPRHQTTARFLPDHNVAVFHMIVHDAILDRSSHLFRTFLCTF